jgi:glyoxylate reductase
VKPYVFVTRHIPDDALLLLSGHADVHVWEGEEAVPRDVLLEHAKKATGLYVLITDKIDRLLLEQSPHLKVISTMAVGYDHIDVRAAFERGIIVTNTPEVLTGATADLTFALILSTARRVVEAAEVIKQGDWNLWSPMFMAGQEVHGKTLGIIGMGRIGEAVAKRARGFDMHVLYHNRNPRPDAEQQWGVQYRPKERLLQESDFVVLLTPGNENTRHIMGAEEFSLMKPTGIFINVSRGSTVNEEALVQALTDKQILGAGLDVFENEPIGPDHPLLNMPQVICLPHIGSATIETRQKMALTAAEGMTDVLQGKMPKNAVKGTASDKGLR